MASLVLVPDTIGVDAHREDVTGDTQQDGCDTEAASDQPGNSHSRARADHKDEHPHRGGAQDSHIGTRRYSWSFLQGRSTGSGVLATRFSTIPSLCGNATSCAPCPKCAIFAANAASSQRALGACGPTAGSSACFLQLQIQIHLRMRSALAILVH